MWPPDRGPADLGLRILDLHNQSFVGSPRIVAHGLVAHGSRATNSDSAQVLLRSGSQEWGPRLRGPGISGNGFGICTTTHSMGAHGLGPADGVPTDIGLRIWDLHDHSRIAGPRAGTHGLGAHGSRATDLGSAQPLIRLAPTDCGPLTGGPRISRYGLGIFSFAPESKSVARDPLAPNPWAPPLGPQRMRGFTDPKSVARNPWAPNPFAPTESSGCAASRSVARDPCATNPRAPLE